MILRFTKDHEWIKVEGADDVATVGVTDYAQAQLGDIVYVELPAVGQSVTQGQQAAVVESVKAASEIYAPVSGKVTEINPALEDQPALVNSEPETGAWFFKLTLSDKTQLEDLMDEADYKEFVQGLDA